VRNALADTPSFPLPPPPPPPAPPPAPPFAADTPCFSAGTYAPFFIRLAWHCSGTYRTSDGRGGCDGGRQRFDPERSWDDNTNLDKARRLLEPLKEKYGAGLSWGDLFVLAGTTAIEHMGGPWAGFCAGRVDDDDGHESLPLGPGAVQESLWPCGGPGNPLNGSCQYPLGQSVVGLIYVNPGGPMGVPDPKGSAADIRDVFGRMTMDDTETVALIGGGHTFGKAHGACPGGAGLSPAADPEKPWAGTCGTGVGGYATTAGFEGPWTSNPTKWDNDYFKNLLTYEKSWAKVISPGGATQWQAAGGATAPRANDSATAQDVMMLTTDVALLNDPTYRDLVQQFAEDVSLFSEAFGAAWYKLTTRDMGPVTRCVGDMTVQPPLPWQNPLPAPPAKLPDYSAVAAELKPLLPEYGSLFVRLAWQCASTFRGSDYQGGCNGARLRLAPAKDWAENKGLEIALDVLEPAFAKHAADGLSWADLIALAGTVAVEGAAGGALDLPFCGGRTDAVDGSGWTFLEGKALTGNASDLSAALLDKIDLLGLTVREFVALSGGHALGGMHAGRSGFTGSWTTTPAVLSNAYYKNILELAYTPITPPGSPHLQYYSAASGADTVYALHTDLMLSFVPELAAHAVDFANNNSLFLSSFGAAWTKLMNADRFDGPTGSVCGAPTEADRARLDAKGGKN